MRKKYPQKATQKPQNYPIPNDLPSVDTILTELKTEIPGVIEQCKATNFVISIHSLDVLKNQSENYLFKLMQKYNDNNENVIFVIDIFWYYKKEIIINAIRHRLRLYKDPLIKLGARQVEVKEISAAAAREFAVKYCLHGARPSSIKLGVYYKDELVSIMTYGKPLLSYNTYNVDVECHRSASKPNVVIVGLIDKILKFLKDNYNVNTVLNYKENLLYNKHDAKQESNYAGEIGLTNYYIIDGVLYPRLQAMNMKNLPLPISCYDKISTPGSAIYIMKIEDTLKEMFK